MNLDWTILGMAAGIFALRFVGLALPRLNLPGSGERALAHLPVALLTALVVQSSLTAEGNLPARLVTVGVGGLVAWWSGRMWACIGGGLALYWCLGLL